MAAPRSCWERLRRESGARALAVADDAATGEGAVRWIPLLESDLRTPEESGRRAWEVRLRSVSSSPQAPLVFLWVARERGEAPQFLKAISELGDRMIRMLQRDRVPPCVSAVIYVAEQGLDESDVVALETIACAGRNLPDDAPGMPPGLSEVLGRRGRATYLMSRRTRVGPQGTSWDVSEVWPVEVARLLASLESTAPRQPGIRAWRSLRFNPTRFDFDRIELEAFRLAREAVGLPDAAGGRVVEGRGRQLPVARPPDSTVPTDRSPQHCRDAIVRPGTRPALAGWWDLGENAATDGARERTETFGSRRGPRSPWFQRFDERGRVFVEDRRELSLESVEETIGPKAIGAQAWSAVHDDPSLPNWYASGQFFVGPDPRTDVPADGLRHWTELNAIERKVIEHRGRAQSDARDLDVARSHFVGMGWRFVCAAASALFIATVFSSLFAAAGWRWALAMALAASSGAIAASVLVAWREVLAGRRGRDAVERSIEHAESSIAESFLRRMVLGAEGERLGRRRRWFQAAARTRDATGRLKAIVDLAEIHALNVAAADAPALLPGLRQYEESTTVGAGEPPLPVDALRKALHDDPAGIMERRRRDHESWWCGAMRDEDPLFTGAIRRRTFSPRVTAAISAMVDLFRRDLIRLVELRGDGADSRWSSQERFLALLGPSGDLRNLGVQTQRARGRDLERVVWVHAAIRRHAQAAAADMASHFGHGINPQAVVSGIDRWGSLGLMIDEIAIGFRLGEAGVACIDADTGALVWEGSDRRGPVARSGGSAS